MATCRPPRRSSDRELRAFVLRATTLRDVPDLPGVRLRMADDVMAVCGSAGALLGMADPPLPFWAFPWAGGLALARYLADHPGAVSGARVVDLAAGSGLCAIVAARSGASAVRAIDVDRFSRVAVVENARANGVRVAFTLEDPLDGPVPDCDVLLAGDVCYEAPLAARSIAWLGGASERGVRVLLGDPGRRYLPGGLVRLAEYDVRTSRELEDVEVKPAAVYTFRAAGDS
jgi:predicted nicotinamide N-methyase